VRVGDRVRAQVLGARTAAGPLRETDEEALIGREAVDRFQVFVRRRFLPGDVRERERS
jgi:hypothetical protein